MNKSAWMALRPLLRQRVMEAGSRSMPVAEMPASLSNSRNSPRAAAEVEDAGGVSKAVEITLLVVLYVLFVATEAVGEFEVVDGERRRRWRGRGGSKWGGGGLDALAEGRGVRYK